MLVRALEPMIGIDEMARSRGITLQSPADLKKLTSGPGRLAEAFGITRARDNGKDLTSRASDLRIVEGDYRPARVITTERIGITKAAERPLRFLVAENGFVSRATRSN